jgi:hypothetical protein
VESIEPVGKAYTTTSTACDESGIAPNIMTMS